MDINLDWNSSHVLENPDTFIKKFNISDNTKKLIISTRKEIKDILSGKLDKLIVIVGPCSIHDRDSAIEYAKKLSEIKDRYKNLLIIMRTYFEKPRTVLGWKGLIYDPDLDNSCNLSKGLVLSRNILIDILSYGITPATEFLDTILPQYYSDLIVWGAIGARTVESQIHRQLSSGLSCPIGFKNSSSGDIKVAVDACIMSRSPHAFPGINKNGKVCLIKTTGNPCTNIILRGSYNNGTNYDKLDKAFEMCQERNLNSKIIIDCSHGNSNKNHKNQNIVINYIIDNYIFDNGYSKLGGIMLESHLNEGNQKISSNMKYGVSITDACINFEETIQQLEKLNSAIQKVVEEIEVTSENFLADTGIYKFIPTDSGRFSNAD